jgi:hypothetical protein
VSDEHRDAVQLECVVLRCCLLLDRRSLLLPLPLPLLRCLSASPPADPVLAAFVPTATATPCSWDNGAATLGAMR